MTTPEHRTNVPLIVGCIIIGGFAAISNTMQLLDGSESISDGAGLLAGLVLLYHGIAQAIRRIGPRNS